MGFFKKNLKYMIKIHKEIKKFFFFFFNNNLKNIILIY